MLTDCTRWLAANSLAGKTIVRVGRRGDELIAEFVGMGRLMTTAGGANAHFEPAEGAPRDTLQKLRASLVEAFVRHAQGKMTLHGGAMSLDSLAVAFVGPSGSGKSTLTAALCLDGKIGLVADDTVAIEFADTPSPAGSVEVVPTQKAAWLLPEARKALGFDAACAGKQAIPFRSCSSKALKLAAVVGLVFDADAAYPELTRLRGQEAFATLFQSTIRFVIDDPLAQLREMDQLNILVQACPVYELRRARDLNQLGHAAIHIRQLLTSSGSNKEAR
jgi:hypothetical protein